jgi:hypothetical protein
MASASRKGDKFSPARRGALDVSGWYLAYSLLVIVFVYIVVS